MPTRRATLTLVTAPSAKPGDTEFWLSAPEPIEDRDGDWGFAIYANKDVFLATLEASVAMVEVLKGATFITTAES